MYRYISSSSVVGTAELKFSEKKSSFIPLDFDKFSKQAKLSGLNLYKFARALITIEEKTFYD
jgi:hypothetical protein